MLLRARPVNEPPDLPPDWHTADWLPRSEQVAIVLLGMVLAAWTFDRGGGDAAGLGMALAVFAIGLAAAWYARSIG